MKKLLVSGIETHGYGSELDRAYSILSSSGAIEKVAEQQITTTMSGGGYDVVIAAGISIRTVQALRAAGVVVIVLGPLATYSGIADIVIDHQANDELANYGTARYALSNEKFDLTALTDLARKLEWDTDFWGYGVGSLKTKTLTPGIYTKVEAQMKSQDVKVLEYLCSVDDRDSMRTAEDLGFHLADVRVTFEMKARKIEIDPLPAGLTYGMAEPRHIPELIHISQHLYRESRYYFDGNFDKKRVSDFYNMWVEKAVYGTFDHLCYCIFDGDRPVGFATFRHYGHETGYIGLAGFAEENKGQGLGKKLFSHLVNDSVERGMKRMVTATQGRNYSAARLFESIGFKTSMMELWYHKWL